MQKKQTPSYLRTHRLRGKVMQFALGAEDAELRERAASSQTGRAAKTLAKEGGVSMGSALAKLAHVAQIL